MTELEQLEARVENVRSRMQAACCRAGRDPSSVLLCAASKTQSSATVSLAADLPIDIFGENRVQELVEKHEAGAYKSIPLHFIGHLQSNKVRQVVGTASLLHSIDSEKLLHAVEKEAARQNIVQDILLEVNLAGEESKSGVLPENLPALAALSEELLHLRVMGLMCVPPRTTDEAEQHKAFETMRLLSEKLSALGLSRLEMRHLSMGMSGDFEAAIEEGATIIRVGTSIFGPRSYSAV